MYYGGLLMENHSRWGEKNYQIEKAKSKAAKLWAHIFLVFNLKASFDTVKEKIAMNSGILTPHSDLNTDL